MKSAKEDPKMNLPCNNSKEEQVYKALCLFNCNNYVGSRKDIWYGANYLSNLSDEECREIILENVRWRRDVKAQKRKNNQIYIVYHKIKKYSSGKERLAQEYDGFFTILNASYDNTFLHSYFTFRALMNKITYKNYFVLDVLISYGDGIRGLRKGGGKNE